MPGEEWYEREVTNKYEKAIRDVNTITSVYEHWIQDERKKSYFFEKISLIPGPAYLFYRISDLSTGGAYGGWDIFTDITVGLPSMALFLNGFDKLTMKNIKPDSIEATVGFAKELTKKWDKQYKVEIAQARREYEGLTSIGPFLDSI